MTKTTTNPATAREPLQGFRRHKLMTAALYKASPAVGATDGMPEARATCKWFEVSGARTIWIFEASGDYCYGFVEGTEFPEFGYFSLAEVASCRNRLGIPAFERDCHVRAEDLPTIADCKAIQDAASAVPLREVA